MGTLPEDTLANHLKRSDALVVMKIGRNLEKVHRAIDQAGRLPSAWLVENATMPNEKVSRLSEIKETVSPYFSIIIIHGQGRRP